MGASAWCLQDLFGSEVAQSAMPMKHDSPSTVRGEYEGLLNGLDVARSLNVKSLKIQCSNETIVAHLTGQTNLFFHTLYNQVEDLLPSIQFLMNKFQKVSVELVSVGCTSHVVRLAEDTIDEVVMSKYSPRLSDVSLSTRASSPVFEPETEVLAVPPGLGFDTSCRVKWGFEHGEDTNLNHILNMNHPTANRMSSSSGFGSGVISDNGPNVVQRPSKNLAFPSLSELSPWLVRNDKKGPRMDQSMLF